METIKEGVWTYYVDEGYDEMDPDRLGKWMIALTDLDEAAEACADAVECGIVCEAKHHTSLDDALDRVGVCCFYLEGGDRDAHRRILSYLLEMDFVPRTEAGDLEDMPFKYDYQTRAGEYDDGFVPKLKLSDFVDLKTGAWLV